MIKHVKGFNIYLTVLTSCILLGIYKSLASNVVFCSQLRHKGDQKQCILSCSKRIISRKQKLLNLKNHLNWVVGNI